MVSEIWGGDRANMIVGATSTQISLDCGTATITGPIKPDRRGAFSATGYFEDFAAGRIDPDRPPKHIPTRFSGQLTADRLDLTMAVRGEPKPRHFRLAKGTQVKLIRCM